MWSIVPRDGQPCAAFIIATLMQRRDFFRHTASVGAQYTTAAAALLAWQRLFAAPPSAMPALRTWSVATEVFTLGVASGEPLPTSVVLWTRLAPKPLEAGGGMPPQPVAVQWELAHDRRFGQIFQRGEAIAEPARAHSVHVEVDGLQGGRQYFYRFIAAGQTSAVGRTRTAPEPRSEPARLRIALASCQHYEMGAYTAHREIATSDVDFVLFVGDYIYETTADTRLRLRRHDIDLENHYTLDNYRRHYGTYKQDPDLQACHAAHPWLMTWDDHEVINDYDGDQGYIQPREAFLQVRARAYQAYFEHTPISPRRAPVGPGAMMHTRYSWGRLADLWLLDTRQFRSPPACTDPLHSPYGGRLLWRCDATADESRSMLGSLQERWLADTLAASRGAWRLIAQSTQMSQAAFDTPLGRMQYADGWDAFPAARDRLMAAIAQPRVPDVVCLGGDVHRHVAANLRLHPTDLESAIIASEFVTSSITTHGLSEFLTNRIKAANPDLLHVRSDERGYALLDVTPEALRCDFRATLHPVRADSRFRTQASYVVERGTAGPRRV